MIEFPKLLRILFKECCDVVPRYIFIRGGRGSAKSWSVARALLLRGTKEPERVLCTREVQKSIKQSVHQLLKDQINVLRLGAFYQVLENEIRGLNGTRFFFSGLSDLTADSIKSFEGCTVCWIEEGQSITKRSWDILDPTIRADGAQIIVTYNPQLESDEIHKLAMSEMPDSISIEINYCDNPWFPESLEKVRQRHLATKPKAEYEHIWLGKCMPAVQGAIYFDEVADTQAQGRVCRLQYDPLLKVHTIWDLGFNDSMSIIFVQRLASEIRVIEYIEDNRRTIQSYLTDDITPKGWNWGNDYLPHDGFAKRHQTGKSDSDVMIALGRNVLQIPSNDIEQGIRNARQVFPRIYFNSESNGVKRLLECLKRYRRHISASTNEATKPVHDEFSHGADAFRYLCLVADELRNDVIKPKQIEPVSYGPGGWMG